MYTRLILFNHHINVVLNHILLLHTITILMPFDDSSLTLNKDIDIFANIIIVSSFEKKFLFTIIINDN